MVGYAAIILLHIAVADKRIFEVREHLSKLKARRLISPKLYPVGPYTVLLKD